MIRESSKHLLAAVSHEYKLGLGGAQLSLLLSLVWIREGCLTLNSWLVGTEFQSPSSTTQGGLPHREFAPRLVLKPNWYRRYQIIWKPTAYLRSSESQYSLAQCPEIIVVVCLFDWCVCVCVCVCACVCARAHAHAVHALSHSVMSDSVTQAPLSMRFSRQEYWSGLSFPAPGDLSDPGIKPASLESPVLSGRFFTSYTLVINPLFP